MRMLKQEIKKIVEEIEMLIDSYKIGRVLRRWC